MRENERFQGRIIGKKEEPRRVASSGFRALLSEGLHHVARATVEMAGVEPAS